MAEVNYLALRRATLLSVFLTAVGLYALYIARFFPNPSGHLGHDYAYFLPLLLAGVFWTSRNGWLEPPVFLPSFCGGVPYIANPQSFYLSLPQLLAHFVEPIRALYVTTIVFATLGAIGTFLLLRRSFQLSDAAATVGAIAFLFNGFLMYRMVVGHLTYHGFGLLPLLAFVALGDSSRARLGGTIDILARMAWFGIGMSYLVYSGAVNFVVPALLTVVALGLCHHALFGWRKRFWLVVSVGTIVAGGISVYKLVPALALVSHFPRLHAPLALFDSYPRALWQLLNSLIAPSPVALTTGLGRGRQGFGQHEFEFGVSMVCGVWAAAGAWFVAREAALCTRVARLGWPRATAWTLAVVLLALPVVLVTGSEHWGAFLKTLPYIKNNVLLIRWWAIYVPFTILLSALGFDRYYRHRPGRQTAAAITAGLIILLGYLHSSRFYERPDYDPGPIVHAYRAAQSGHIPTIHWVEAVPGNDGLTRGMSSLACYEPIFGYWLEEFPRGSLREGSIYDIVDGELNFKNPACYIYGNQNSCAPGAHFRASQVEALTRFAYYVPFEYGRPAWHSAITIASVATLVGCTVAFLLQLYMLSIARSSHRRDEGLTR